jgi:hypothetical protein
VRLPAFYGVACMTKVIFAVSLKAVRPF